MKDSRIMETSEHCTRPREYFYRRTVLGGWPFSLLRCLGRTLLLLIALFPAPYSAQADDQIGPNPNNGTISVSGDDWNDIDFTNNGALNITFTGTLCNNCGATLNNNGTMTNDGAVCNEGTVNIASGASLTNNGNLANDGGASLTNNGTVTNVIWLVNSYGSTITNNGTLVNQTGALLENLDGAFIVNNGLLTNNGLVGNDDISTLTNNGTLVNNIMLINVGTLTNNAGAAITNTSGGVIMNVGTFVNSAGAALINNGTLRNRAVPGWTGNLINNGTFTNNGRFINDAVFVNSGTLTNNAGAAITNNDTFVNQGTFVNNGTFTTGTGFTNTGTLKGIGTIAGNVVNNGTIAPGNSIGTLTIAGNYTHGAGAVYALEISPAGQYDNLTVTGTATLNGGTVRVSVLAGPRTFNENARYTLLTAGTVTGAFAAATSNLTFLTPFLSYDPTHVYLLFGRSATGFADVALTPNQYAVASTLDRAPLFSTGDMNTVIHNLLWLSPSEARDAFDQMGGLIHTALTGAVLSSFNRYMGTMTDRMNGFMAGNPSMSAGAPLMLASRADMGSDSGNTLLLAALGSTVRNEGKPRFGLWMKAYGSMGLRRGGDISSRYDSDLAGVVAGFDRIVTPSFLLGASLGYSYTKVTMKDLSDRGRVSGYQASLYGTFKKDPWYVSGITAYGYNRYDTSRDISFGDIRRTANADYRGHTLGGYLETGYRIATRFADITPMVSLVGSYLTRGTFTESDAGALNLDADSENTSSLMGSLGVRLSRNFPILSGTLTPELRVRWDHEFINGDYALDASFAGSALPSFTIRTDRPDRDSLALGLSLAWQAKETIYLYVTYDGSFSGDDTQHSGTLGVKYRW